MSVSKSENRFVSSSDSSPGYMRHQRLSNDDETTEEEGSERDPRLRPLKFLPNPSYLSPDLTLDGQKINLLDVHDFDGSSDRSDLNVAIAVFTAL